MVTQKRMDLSQGPFTLLRQTNELVAAQEADPDLGFMGRMLALCSFPRTNPGNRTKYVRANGPYTLYMLPGPGNKLPYGSVPRLLLAWLCTEAVRTQSRDLVLGRSLAKFMRKLGITSRSGGERGDMTRLRRQMLSLFSASVTLVYESTGLYQRVSSFVVDKQELWWDPKRPQESSLWESKIRLGEELFEEIVRRPVPIDMNVLKALKRSSLGLDLYLWLSYRTFSLDKPLRLTWKRIYRQFGPDPAREDDKRTVDAFRTDCLRELKKISLAWPGLEWSTAKGVLIVKPSRPLIAAKQSEE